MTSNQDSLILEEIKLQQLKPAGSTHVPREFLAPSKFSIVYTKKNGKRVTIAPDVIGAIGSPDSVQFAYTNSGVVIGNDLGLDDKRFLLRTSGKKSVIYSGGLAQEIVETFGLDFKGRSTISYDNVKITNLEGKPVAIVTLQGKLQDEDKHESYAEQAILESEATTEHEQPDHELDELKLDSFDPNEDH
ncbi:MULTISPECIES: hypothetical protein [unclassified Paenibacillus]|uniref:hypothetical protein n=1 Tax=unclassified Paenibacillus TaxID=185978 RepID=UPI001AE1BDAB|nr:MULTISPECIES: hypothetical protein [unclassified Paenibacillus]MBP1157680.1 hypothetical protein [Paenibacillus sp. PvP091]MBP1171583.1 hypothetical protein [Paenibacillus sp. PvR098]MBP2437964.1 hypothetical protein [Paenibacillus sp. PvP052]